jgi:radical SAM-linked protein
MSRTKVRIRFSKAGDLRFLSHHDLLRTFERMLRRAELPLHFSQGFHPKPRMVFASALGLGIVGRQEVLEIELSESIAAAEIQERLAEQSPRGLQILSVIPIEPGVTGEARRAVYRLPLTPEQAEGLELRVTELLAAAEAWVERSKPTPRKVNVRTYLLDLSVGDGELIMEMEITPQGAARPEEVLQLLGLGHLLAEGAVLERTALELEDELGREASAFAPPPAVCKEPL